MHRREYLLALVLLAVTTMLLSGCRSPDCEWSAPVRTWVDENENGVWDSDEPPLSNVKVYLESYDVIGIPEAETDESGEAYLNAAMGGCPRRIEFYVYALPPSGYRSSIRALKPAPDARSPEFEFGFIPLNE
jgi:hypothetical protein